MKRNAIIHFALITQIVFACNSQGGATSPQGKSKSPASQDGERDGGDDDDTTQNDDDNPSDNENPVKTPVKNGPKIPTSGDSTPKDPASGEKDPGPGDSSEVVIEVQPDPSKEPGLHLTKVEAQDLSGGPAIKGKPVRLKASFQNTGMTKITRTVKPLLTKSDEPSFRDVKFASFALELLPNTAKTFTFDVPVFIKDVAQSRTFALNRGVYLLDFEMTDEAGTVKVTRDEKFGEFTIKPSRVLLLGLAYNEANFPPRTIFTPATLVDAMVSSKTEIFTPSSPGSTTGTYAPVAKGILGVGNFEIQTHAIAGLAATAETKTREQFEPMFTKTFGTAVSVTTNPHGFDLFMAFDNNLTSGYVFGKMIGFAAKDKSRFSAYNFSKMLTIALSATCQQAMPMGAVGVYDCDPDTGDKWKKDEIMAWHKTHADYLKKRIEAFLGL